MRLFTDKLGRAQQFGALTTENILLYSRKDIFLLAIASHDGTQALPKKPKMPSHPRVLWIGIGCKRGITREMLETAITEVLQKNHLAIEEVAGIATIDTKVNEVGLIELCRDRNLPLKTYPAEILRTILVPNPSNIVAEVGTPSVAEAAALCAANLPHAKAHQRNHQLLIPKQIFYSAVTVAVVQTQQQI